MTKTRMVSVVTAAVLKTLGEAGKNFRAGEEIYIGCSNIDHMRRRHLSDYLKYQDKLSVIISEPDYVGVNDDGSLEYVKMLSDHVKVTVRIAGDERLYIRSMYTVLSSRTEHFIKSGRLKPLTNGK